MTKESAPSEVLARKDSEWNQDNRRRVWAGQVSEAALFAVLDDRSASKWSCYMAVTGLARVYGDDERAAREFRIVLSDPQNDKADTYQLLALLGLVIRAGSEARPELERYLKSRFRVVRSAALNGLAFIGDASHCDELTVHFQRAISRGQQEAGGFGLVDLATYLFACARFGASDANSLKTLIRDNWAHVPEGRSGDVRSSIERMLPGIDDDAVPLDDIEPKLEFREFQRPAPPR